MALFRFPKRKTWWYEFRFCGQLIRESARTRNKEIARRAERHRRQELEEGFHNLNKKVPPKLFKVASEDWLDMKAASLSPKSHLIEKANLRHITPVLGKFLITAIRASDIATYQQRRLAEKASPKTVNLELGTIRAILRQNRVWEHLRPDVRMLPTRDDVGRAITSQEEQRLLVECLNSRSRCLYPAVVMALNTGFRYSDVRLLRWGQIDFKTKTAQVGKSKTDYSTGRVVYLNTKALKAITEWADQFPNRKLGDYVFPAERYGGSGDEFEACAYSTDPERPIGSFKKAWEAAKKKAGVTCRFHDLRHTACTRMLEAGTPFAVVAAVMGWSPSTTVRMAKRYGHIGHEAHMKAVESIAIHEQTREELP